MSFVASIYIIQTWKYFLWTKCEYPNTLWSSRGIKNLYINTSHQNLRKRSLWMTFKLHQSDLSVQLMNLFLVFMILMLKFQNFPDYLILVSLQTQDTFISWIGFLLEPHILRFNIINTCHHLCHFYLHSMYLVKQTIDK